MADPAAHTEGQPSFSLPFTLGNDDTTGTISIVAAGATLKGNLTTNSEIRVLGTVEGDLNSGSRITVVAGAQVRGRLVAAEIIVSGLVIGDVMAAALLSIRPSGEVRGTVVAGSMELELGGTVTARCSVDQDATQPS
jgi:cytoskeletal protein CcmA (bactofilin family)